MTDARKPTADTASKQFTITIAAGVSITTTSLATGTIGVAYSAPVAATGGATPYAWSAVGLPAGFTINASTGAISGTTNTASSGTVTVTVTDATSPTHLTASKDFTLTIAASLDITTTTLAGGAIGTPYSATLAAAGGTPPYSWTATGLPDAVTIDSTTGAISGTPSAAGSFTVNVTVTDAATPTHHTASKSFPLTIGSTLTITTASLANASPGVAYSAPVAAAGGVPPYTWSATGLPDGLTMASSGLISGTATTIGASTVHITVTDSTTPVHRSVSKDLPLTVALGLTLSPPSITITGNGNQATLTLQLSAPAPAGGIEFTVSSSNTGVATVPGFAFLSQTSTSTGLRVLSVSAGTAVIHVSGPGIPDQTVNVTVLPPGSITLTGPATLGLSQNGTMNISLSTPAPVGGVTVTLTSSDPTRVSVPSTTVAIPANATTPVTQPQIFGVNVGSASITASAPGYTSSAPVLVNVNATVTWVTQGATISGIGNTTLLTLRLSAAAPVDQSTGVSVNLSSSNPAVATIQPTGIFIWDGSSAPGIVLQVTSVGSGTTTIHASGVNIPDVTTTVTVVGPVTITSASLPNGSVGALYNGTVVAAGGVTPYTWSATGLPAPLTINSSTGVISGTPTAGGAITFTATATDSSSPTHQSSNRQFTDQHFGRLDHDHVASRRLRE